MRPTRLVLTLILTASALLAPAACRRPSLPHAAAAREGGASDAVDAIDARSTPSLPLALVADVPLPGGATRFDYMDLDPTRRQLVIAHMNDASVVVVDLRDGSVLKELRGIPTPRGVVIAASVGLIFVTSSPRQLVIIDRKALTEIRRVPTGNGPDGVAWDPAHEVVAVSDQRDGAISLLAGAGSGARTQVPLGTETGNVVHDAARGCFWITVVAKTGPDQLVAVDPITAKVTARVALPGCEGAHGLRLHPDGASAFVACESNEVLARVALTGAHAVSTARTGGDPDVLAIDPALGFLYVAAESGDLTVFDLRAPGVALLDREHAGDHAHTVAVDAATHRVFFPLMAGPAGAPVLRIMKPRG